MKMFLIGLCVILEDENNYQSVSMDHEVIDAENEIEAEPNANAHNTENLEGCDSPTARYLSSKV